MEVFHKPEITFSDEPRAGLENSVPFLLSLNKVPASVRKWWGGQRLERRGGFTQKISARVSWMASGLHRDKMVCVDRGSILGGGQGIDRWRVITTGSILCTTQKVLPIKNRTSRMHLRFGYCFKPHETKYPWKPLTHLQIREMNAARQPSKWF